MHKTCTKCGEEKLLDGFGRNRSTNDGLQQWCQECHREYDRRYYHKNREGVIERVSLWRDENPTKVRESARRYRAENQEQISEYHTRYYADNRDYLARTNRNGRVGYQQLSKAFATVPPYTPWSASEEKFLLDDNGMTVYQKAIELGRTHASCQGRLQKLRNQ